MGSAPIELRMFKGARLHNVRRADREPLVRFMVEVLEEQGCRIPVCVRADDCALRDHLRETSARITSVVALDSTKVCVFWPDISNPA